MKTLPIQNLETGYTIMSRLASDAAIELDLYRLGENDQFEALERITTIVGNGLMKPEDIGEVGFSGYLPIRDAIDRSSEKDPIVHFDQLGLEVRLLYGELTSFRDDPQGKTLKRVEELRDFCIDLSSVYSAKEEGFRYSLVA
jgi:hypothetical protein